LEALKNKFMKDPKLQEVEPPAPQGLPSDVIISPDTLRKNRIQPRQSRTRKWPVLDASGPPKIDRVFSDFHCVTRWSRLGNL
jgi:hypothetical protein